MGEREAEKRGMTLLKNASRLPGARAWLPLRQDEAEALLGRVVSLEAALREYGDHKPHCQANYHSRPTLNKCDCGLAAVLSGVPEANPCDQCHDDYVCPAHRIARILEEG